MVWFDMDISRLIVHSMQESHYNDVKLCYSDAVRFDTEEKDSDIREWEK
jgi:hypothetical protein